MSKQAMIDTFQKHVGAELAGDLDTTMATMSVDPHLNHVPTMAGGVGREGVRNFYRDHLVGKFFPPDVKMTNVSSTVGDKQIVDEIFISFTHTTEIDWLLPGSVRREPRIANCYLSSQTSSMRQPLKMLLTMTVHPLTWGRQQVARRS